MRVSNRRVIDLFFFVLGINFLCLIPVLSWASEQPGAVAKKEDYDAFERKGLKSKWKKSWTPGLLSEIKNHKAPFEQASDTKSVWCTKANATKKNTPDFEKVNDACYFRIITGIMAFESGYNPNAPCGTPYDKIASCGMLQIQKRNCTKFGFNDNDLKKPENTFRCGLDLMASTIKRDKYISSTPKQVQSRHGNPMIKRIGLSRPWSVMISKHDPNWGHVGHLEEIYAGMKGFADKKDLGTNAQVGQTK